MKVVLLTSTSSRHLAFAWEMAQRHELLACYCEEKSFDPYSGAATVEERQTIEAWFRDRDIAEALFFEDRARHFLRHFQTIIQTLPAGAINSDRVVQDLRTPDPIIFAVFGSSVIKGSLLKLIQGRAFNLHLGLSPHYRGSGTNFWPIVDGCLEYIGTTVHLLDAHIDGGPIARQGRPAIEKGDSPHSIGCKAMEVGFEHIAITLSEYAIGSLLLYPQPVAQGKIFRRRDFGALAVQEANRRLAAGLVDDYVKQGGRPVSIVQ
jgi:hypothetical protein